MPKAYESAVVLCGPGGEVIVWKGRSLNCDRLHVRTDWESGSWKDRCPGNVQVNSFVRETAPFAWETRWYGRLFRFLRDHPIGTLFFAFLGMTALAVLGAVSLVGS